MPLLSVNFGDSYSRNRKDRALTHEERGACETVVAVIESTKGQAARPYCISDRADIDTGAYQQLETAAAYQPPKRDGEDTEIIRAPVRVV